MDNKDVDTLGIPAFKKKKVKRMKVMKGQGLLYIFNILKEKGSVKKEEIAPSSHIILDLGGDSFTYMSIIASVEAEFNIKIATDMIGRLNTVNEFTLYILQNKN